MSATLNVHQAKTHFSNLIDRAHAGEEIIIAKAGKPWAKLSKIGEPPVEPLAKRRPGGWPELAALCDDAMTSPLTGADLDAWERKFDDL